MRHLDQLLTLARRQHGLIARRQVSALGLDASEWGRMRTGVMWSEVTSRVLRLAGSAPSRGEALMAAVLDDEAGARIAASTAVWWWGVPGFSARPIHLIRTASTRRKSPLAVVHRVRHLDDRWTTVLDGVPVVRPELAILHLAATEHPAKVARALDNAWSMRLLSGPSVAALLADYGKRGRNGTAVLREVMEERGPGYVPPASNLEARVRAILLEHGIRMRLQVDSGSERWTGRVDFRDEDTPLVLEVQSERFHSALVDRSGDERRKARLEADGFAVVEVTDVEVWSAPNVVVERVRAKRAELRRRFVS